MKSTSQNFISALKRYSNLIRRTPTLPTRHNARTNAYICIPSCQPSILLPLTPSNTLLFPTRPLLNHPFRRPEHTPLSPLQIPHPYRPLKIPLIHRITRPTPPHHTPRK